MGFWIVKGFFILKVFYLAIAYPESLTDFFSSFYVFKISFFDCYYCYYLLSALFSLLLTPHLLGECPETLSAHQSLSISIHDSSSNLNLRRHLYRRPHHKAAELSLSDNSYYHHDAVQEASNRLA
jgi:hypothetical protein